MRAKADITRPSINFKESQDTTPEETFQNEVLRPILKYHNDLIIYYFRHIVLDKRMHIDKMDHTDKSHHILKLLQKDITLRNVLLGIVISMMTPEEYVYYFKNESMLKSRIITMLHHRILDQI